MTKTEIKLHPACGRVSYYTDEAAVLAESNEHGNWYIIRDGENGRELYHKGHRRVYAVLETIPVRD